MNLDLWTTKSRVLFSTAFVTVCLIPTLFRISLYPFLTYDMFVNERLLPRYYIPIAVLSDGTEKLIYANNILFPYRIVCHDFVRRYDLQYIVEDRKQTGQLASLKSELRRWCRRTPNCRGASLYQYDQLFRNGLIDLTMPRSLLVSWNSDEQI